MHCICEAEREGERAKQLRKAGRLVLANNLWNFIGTINENEAIASQIVPSIEYNI